MSTLGGSKGERNAKPKFSALDINRIYKQSRGESVEPAAQKNQVPRKHGMQSLGKVPSTRRPPANLPSLKAEVRIPGTNTTNSNSNSIQTSGSIVNNNNNNTSSTLTSSKQDNLINSSSSAQGTLLNHHHHQNHLSTSSTSATAASSSIQQTLANSSSSSITWSSVTTGHDVMGAGNNNTVPPHYQSLQFQHEFPSLDGSVSGNKGLTNQQPNKEGNLQQHQQHHPSSSSHHSNHQQNFRDGNTGNGNEVSLRPQTDAASWHQRNQHQKEQQMQEQLLQQTSGNNKFTPNDSSINNQSGDGSSKTGGGQSPGQGHQQHHHNNPAAVVPPPLRALMPSFMMRGTGDTSGSGSRSLTPPTGQQQTNGSNFQQRNYHQNRSSSPNFLRGQGGKRPSPIGGRVGSASSPYETDAVLQQRPIIKEEELERMNALSKSDGWALPDEIDYNKQLALSDDESPDNTPTVERDRPLQFPKIKKDEKQNGHRPSTNVDQAALERAKLRKEEEERREQERRDGARKKLHELEMKMGASVPSSAAIANANLEIDEEGSDISLNRRQYPATATNRYERDFQRPAQANKSNFSSHFQSNLPPRFQRQQAMQAAAAAAQTNQTTSSNGGGGTGNGRPPTTQNTANFERDMRDPAKPVSFAQQYDPRYIHSQQNYKHQQQQPQQRRGVNYGRNRSDNSENDDEFSRFNRRSGGDSDHQGRGITRSISDSSSNRKISCSSNDEPQRSDSRDHLPGSWAEESDIHIGRRHRDESFSSSHSKTDDMEQGHVKILQRPPQNSQTGGAQSQNKTLPENSTKNEKILEEEEIDSKSFAPTQILRRTESPKSATDIGHQDESNKTDIKDLEKDKKVEKSSQSGSQIKETISDPKKSEVDESSGQTGNRIEQKRQSPRSTTGPHRSDRGTYPSRGGYSSYGSSNRGGGSSWGRRGGSSRNDRSGRHYNEWSESENSEMGDDDYNGRRNERSPKNPKKEHGSSRNIGCGHKEGFAPRGEPSRRGRGGGGGNMSVTSSSFRRAGGSSGSSSTVSARRNDSYNSKSGFPSSSIDDSKDKSLDEGKKRDLEKKDEKKGTIAPKSSSSSSISGSYQHNRKESTSSSKNEDLGKRDEKKDNIPQRSTSSGQIKSSTATTTSANAACINPTKKDDRKTSVTKPPPGYNTNKSSISPQSQPVAQKISNSSANQTKNSGNQGAQQNHPQQWVSSSETSVTSVTSTSSSQILDSTSTPVNTIIFENTNYKASTNNLEGSKPEPSATIDTTETLTASLTQMSLNAADVAAATAEYEKEMKMGAFGCFDAEFPTRLTSSGSAVNEDKSSSLPRSSSNSSVVTSASDLNLKIASVKKVWDTTTLSPLMEQHNSNEAAEQLQQQAQQLHHHQQIPQQQLQHLASHIHAYNTFEDASNAAVVVSQDSTVDIVKQSVEANKVKSTVQQQQQLHHTNLGLSPPPSIQQQQQQQQQLQHQVAPTTQQFYPPSQYPTAAGIPTIPSPPVLFNSSAIAPSQSGMYPFIEPRSQFSQFPTHYSTTGTGAPYNAYMQTPQMQTAPPQAQNADFYANIRSAYPQYRMSGTVQSFNQSQQISNPNAVLISSNSNSLISTSSKPPSNQQLGTIGSKNNVDAAIASVNYGQQYMNLYQQQGPPPHGGHHSQIPSSSYYSNSAGAYFSAAANSGAGTQSYGMFGGHAGSTGGNHSANGPPPGPPQQIPNFSSQFQGNAYNTLLTPAALNQFRGAGAQQQSQQAQGQQANQQQQYMKATNQGPQNHLQDSMGRQLKSPLGADVTLTLGKQIQPQQSPPHHKNYSQSWDMNQVIQQQQSQQQQQQQQQRNNQQNAMNSSGRSGGIGQGPQRYPAPIQRPTNYPQHPSQQNQQRQLRHEGGNRSQGGNNGPPMNKHYYGNSGGNRGQHPSNQIAVEQHKNQTQLDKDGNVSTITQQEMTVKEDNSND